MLSMCLLFFFVIFWMLCCVMYEKKKLLITKKKKDPRREIKFRPLSLFDFPISINDLNFNPNCIFIYSICFTT